MEKEITRRELYSLREAIHLTSFGLEPGDKEASALADELTSEIINERIAGLRIQEYSYRRIQLPGFPEILPQKNKSLFGISSTSKWPSLSRDPIVILLAFFMRNVPGCEMWQFFVRNPA